VLCLVGSLSIAALPPLNGFISEWLTFQVLLSLPQALVGITGKAFSALLIALLGLTGALAAACFATAFGITFLAKPRSTQAAKAVEAAPSMLVAMGMLAGLCIVVGLWPGGMLSLLSQTLMNFPGIDIAGLANHDWYVLPSPTGQNDGGISTVAMILLLLSGAAVALLLHSIFGRGKVDVGETWTCGNVPNCHMEYTATGFSKSIRMVFKRIVHSHYETVVNANDNQYHGRLLFYQVRIKYLFDSALYSPINKAIIRVARFLKSIQTGSVQLYVGYIMAVTVAILIWSTGW